MEALYALYRQHLVRIADLKNSLALLQWDQETYLPPKGIHFRSQQVATLSEQIHHLSTSEELGEALQQLLESGSLSPSERKNVEISWDDFSKQQKYAPAFVRKLSETVSRSFHAWTQARQARDFRLFEKSLEEIISLKRQEADILGYSAHPYDALLNEHEKGCTVQMLDPLFEELLGALKPLLDQIYAKPQVDDQCLRAYYPKDLQWKFGLDLLQTMGFDLEAGRQDESAHPFTTSFNCRDVRLTTRIDENNLAMMTWSCLHEGGHGLYEQGLPEVQYGLPAGEFSSLSVHESQSRLWENNVGRSLAFWESQYPKLQIVFPEQLREIPVSSFFKAINKVQPSLIRTESDELTYHFHIAIRYELEKQLIEGRLRCAEIPEYWNAQYAKYLGLTVPDDAHGCLQDVHWSHGSFGYFPTYSLGSLYAAQWFQAAQRQIPGLETDLEKGLCRRLLVWLKDQIFVHGRHYTSGELSTRISKKYIDPQCFISYILDKYKRIYDL